MTSEWTTWKWGGGRPIQSTEVKAATLAHVKSAHVMVEAASIYRIEMIRAARSFGATWDDIGGAMGMSRQTAHNRFSQYLD